MYKEKPWLRFYESHVPEHINYPNMTLPVALQQTALRHPHQPAMAFKGNWFSYQAFDEAVDRFTTALQRLGVDRGDRVARPYRLNHNHHSRRVKISYII